MNLIYFKICNKCIKDGITKGDNLSQGMPADYCDRCTDRKPRSLNCIRVNVRYNYHIGNLDFWIVDEKGYIGRN